MKLATGFGRPIRIQIVARPEAHDGIFMAINALIFRYVDVCKPCAKHRLKKLPFKLSVAEVPQIDQRVGQGFEGGMDFADRLEAKQQALELVFPGKNAFDGTKALGEDFRIEELFSSPFGGLPATPIFVDIGSHPPIENGFPVQAAIVNTIQTEDGFAQIEADRTGDAAQLRQGLAQQGRLIAIARGKNDGGDDIAVPIAKDNGLVTFHPFVPVKADVVAALLGRRCGAVAMNDAQIEQVLSVQRQDRSGKNGIDTTAVLPGTKHPVHARVVNFRTTRLILVDRQRFPLATRV